MSNVLYHIAGWIVIVGLVVALLYLVSEIGREDDV